MQFPQGSGNECPGPNYIVQGELFLLMRGFFGVWMLIVRVEYGGNYAIVQTAEWGVLYILSRERQPGQEVIDVSGFTEICECRKVWWLTSYDFRGGLRGLCVSDRMLRRFQLTIKATVHRDYVGGFSEVDSNYIIST